MQDLKFLIVGFRKIVIMQYLWCFMKGYSRESNDLNKIPFSFIVKGLSY